VKGVGLTRVGQIDVRVPGGVSKIQRLSSHAPYYWSWLKSLPYAAARRITRRRCRAYPLMEPFFKDQCGLEMGGPSPVFRGDRLIPVYGRCRQIDNCNFSSRTIWDVAGPSAERRPAPGLSFARQFVAEASDLSPIGDGVYDFLLASHVLEHVANPLRALEEWRRVLRPGGAMLVIVPDRRGTFDHRRAPTAFEHIAEDFRNHTPETDLTHLEEILALHDLALDPGAGSALQFRERCLKNAEVRALHHHVFVPEVLVRMFSRAQMRVLSLAIERPFHIVALAERADTIERQEAERQNLDFLGEDAHWRKCDPLKR
jgi:SAM-dependent methyltransferase